MTERAGATLGSCSFCQTFLVSGFLKMLIHLRMRVFLLSFHRLRLQAFAEYLTQAIKAPKWSQSILRGGDNCLPATMRTFGNSRRNCFGKLKSQTVDK